MMGVGGVALFVTPTPPIHFLCTKSYQKTTLSCRPVQGTWGVERVPQEFPYLL